MCGIIGISAKSETASLSIYNALTVLQHRGQAAAGMAVVNKSGFISMHKQNGLVRDVFREEDMIRLSGNVGIGHVRYPTAGGNSKEYEQPMYVKIIDSGNYGVKH